MTFFIICIIAVVVILFIYSKSKQPKKTQNFSNINANFNSGTGYWDGFKRRKPTQAKHIEEITGRDMSCLDNLSAYQIVTTLIRWSENANVSIGELKNYFLKEANTLLIQPGATYEMFLNKLKEEKIKEAKTFGISPDYTACSFMIQFLEEDRQNRLQESITEKLGRKLGMSEEEIEAFSESVNQTAEELNLAPDISKLDREENRLFHLAEEGAKMLNNLTVGLSDNLQLSKAGFAEARILCSTIVIDLHSNFKNEIDLDIQADRYFLLLADPTMCDCDNVEDVISFINSRISFYKKELKEAMGLNALQIIQPNNAFAKIFNALYLHPEITNPEDIVPSEISTNDVIMFRGQLEKVVKYLKTKSKQIRSGISQSESDKLQAEIEDTLMLLFPASKRSQITQDMVFVLTDVILSDLKQGNLNPTTSSVLPIELKSKFNLLARKIKIYSASNDDIDDIIEIAQNNVANKFL